MAENKNNEQQVFVPVEVPKVEPMMIVRLLVFVLALVNAVGAMFGYDLNLSVDQQNVYDIVSAMFLLGSGFHVAWKNNNISKTSRVKAHVGEQVTVDTKGEQK
ncbi:holin [Bacillus phage Thurquoise]|uniref:Lysis protein n=1 Tax=Bacillus phage Deep Blue TaxID=1792245 RepID=A0A140HLU4_9CAUD|nr:holin [Bacillus phage Deep Blue]AMO25956.1 lysis protein [Bacillus phage Deep Blue]UXQ88997.1 holin [Bacillus phage Thurquoise]